MIVTTGAAQREAQKGASKGIDLFVDDFHEVAVGNLEIPRGVSQGRHDFLGALVQINRPIRSAVGELFGQLGDDVVQGDGYIGANDGDPDSVSTQLSTTDSGGATGGTAGCSPAASSGTLVEESSATSPRPRPLSCSRNDSASTSFRGFSSTRPSTITTVSAPMTTDAGWRRAISSSRV